MASIRKEIRINAPASQIWDALKDVGSLHTRLVPGFVTDTKMDGNTRVVTFGNGMVAREEIVSIEPARQRVAWAVVGQQFPTTTARPGSKQIRKAARVSSGARTCCPMNSRRRWRR